MKQHIGMEKIIDELTRENEMLHAENALKLTQILDLEQILYETRVMDMEDSSPCWCCRSFTEDGEERHEVYCSNARKATEMFWKKPNEVS